VRAPEASELPLLRRGSILIALLNPHDTTAISALAATGVTAFAMEAVPRITRAQTMDVLSSQANIAGYKAVMLAANEYGRFMPMLMTAAGTVKAARVLVLGAGWRAAGHRHGEASGGDRRSFDVSQRSRSRWNHLARSSSRCPCRTRNGGARETSGGYAREMSEEYRARQAVSWTNAPAPPTSSSPRR
jgi:NAD(P) transhydrogenase subunit alpha